MQHAFKFQLMETTIYSLLLIFLYKLTIIVLTKYATCILNKIKVSVEFRRRGCMALLSYNNVLDKKKF